MGFFSKVRDKIEEVADTGRERIERKVVYQPKQRAYRKASSEYISRSQEIKDREDRNEISHRLAEKWRGRAKETYEKKRLPVRERAYNWVGSGDQKKPGNWAQNASENFNRTFTGGVETYTDRYGKTKERYRESPKERIRSSLYGRGGRGGASKSYRKTVPREFGIARNETQFGNVLLTGKSTRASTKGFAGGWGIAYGSKAPRSDGTTKRRGRRSRRSSGGRSNPFTQGTGWLF